MDFARRLGVEAKALDAESRKLKAKKDKILQASSSLEKANPKEPSNSRSYHEEVQKAAKVWHGWVTAFRPDSALPLAKSESAVGHLDFSILVGLSRSMPKSFWDVVFDFPEILYNQSATLHDRFPFNIDHWWWFLLKLSESYVPDGPHPASIRTRAAEQLKTFRSAGTEFQELVESCILGFSYSCFRETIPAFTETLRRIDAHKRYQHDQLGQTETASTTSIETGSNPRKRRHDGSSQVSGSSAFNLTAASQRSPHTAFSPGSSEPGPGSSTAQPQDERSFSSMSRNWQCSESANSISDPVTESSRGTPGTPQAGPTGPSVRHPDSFDVPDLIPDPAEPTRFPASREQDLGDYTPTQQPQASHTDVPAHYPHHSQEPASRRPTPGSSDSVIGPRASPSDLPHVAAGGMQASPHQATSARDRFTDPAQVSSIPAPVTGAVLTINSLINDEPHESGPSNQTPQQANSQYATSRLATFYNIKHHNINREMHAAIILGQVSVRLIKPLTVVDPHISIIIPITEAYCDHIIGQPDTVAL